jgi:GAF domain-containing protein/HAMP domain-containing protein
VKIQEIRKKWKHVHETNNMQNSIRTRLTIAFIALTASLLLLVGLVLAWQSYVTEQEQALALQSERARRISAEVVSYMQIQENALTQLVSVRGLGNLDQDQQTQLLSGLISYSNAFNRLALLSNNGLELIVVSGTEVINQYEDLSTDVEFTYPKATRQIYYSPVRISERTSEPYIVMSVPIINLSTGSVTNILVAEVGFKPIWDLLANLAPGEKSNAYIVDAENRVIAHNDPSVVQRNTLFTVPAQDGVEAGLDGTNVVLATDRLKLGDWEFTVVTETPTSEAFANIIRTETTIFALLLVAIVIAGGLGWLVTRQIIQPIESLVKTARDISAGDLSKPAEVTRHDEIGTLAEAFNSMVSQLRDLITNLEARVAERTARFQAASEQSEKRASELQTISDISRVVSDEQELEKLLPHITQVVSERFGFYHVGIFLPDETNTYAVLRATNSLGGQRMLERGHRLEIGQVGIVGKVAAAGVPRIALDVGEDAVYLRNPELPETRSEIALPLKISGRTIGVLDVQSTEPSAFTNEDVNILSILADQIAIAIEKASLLETARKSLDQTEAAYRQYIRNEWMQFSREGKLSGFKYADGESTPLETPINLGEITPIVNAGNVYQAEADIKGKPAQLAVPVKIRDEVIGVLHISTQQKSRWTDDEVDIAESVADHLALALENARLFQASADRATRERIVSDISSKISGNIYVNSILRTAAQELSQALHGSDVLIQIKTPEQASEAEE